MISKLEEAEIRDYLLSKKLPIDILIEVQDHFISEIYNLEREKDLQFSDAFKEVKENWRKDLSLSWKGEFSLIDSTDFTRKITKQIERANILQSLKFAILSVLMVILVANFTNVNFFQAFFIAIIFLPFSYASINYIKHYKEFRLPKKYQSQILTLHQNSILMFFLIISPMINTFSKIFDKPKEFQEMLSFHFSGIANLKIIIVILSLLLFFIGISYSLISQKKYLKQIKTVKPFLKYLKAS